MNNGVGKVKRNGRLDRYAISPYPFMGMRTSRLTVDFLICEHWKTPFLVAFFKMKNI